MNSIRNFKLLINYFLYFYNIIKILYEIKFESALLTIQFINKVYKFIKTLEMYSNVYLLRNEMNVTLNRYIKIFVIEYLFYVVNIM